VQQVPSIPDGAQGIFFPVATCTAYPIVKFPDGALGIVAPWFSLNGLLGQELYSLLPMEPDADGAKTFTGQMTIRCEESFATTCIILGY
jgi:hypothetical protein